MGPVAKEKWKAMVLELKPLGVMTVIDGDALAVLCVTWELWQDAVAALRKHGQTMIVKGVVKPRPEVSIAAKLVAVLRQYQREFGLTPSSRTAIQVTQPPDTVPAGFVRIAKTG